MRFMSIVSSSPQHYGMPTPELMEAIVKLSERETNAGRMVGMGGLAPLEQGAHRVSLQKGELIVHDGPFSESKEVIGGFAIFELNSAEEALALATEFMQLHQRHMPGWEGTCEIRPMATETCAEPA